VGRVANKGEILKLERVTLDGEDFSRRKFRMFTSVQSNFRRCDFRATKMYQATLGGGYALSLYEDCCFDDSAFGMIGGRARFVRCSFRRCRIEEIWSYDSEFVECVFSGRIERGIFRGAPMEVDEIVDGRTHNEFRGNDFSDAELREVAFRAGIDLSQQKLPQGEDYLYLAEGEKAVAFARREVLAWKELESRREAMATIKVLEFGLAEGQPQLLINLRHSLPRDEGTLRVFDLLRRSAAAKT